MQAYIYARFSSMEQSKGGSLERQLTDCRAFCDRKGWDRSSTRELIDEGRSAYHGINRLEGSCLAQFEAMAAAGQLGHETVLVVERLDRLSRQKPRDVLNLVTLLTDAGVTVATVDGERIFKADFDFAATMELVIKAQLAHEESEKKSQRLSASWVQKRGRVSRGDQRALTRQCPAWMGVDDQTGRHFLREDRVAIVRQIFDWSCSGLGKRMIAGLLNREGVASWGRGGRGWHPSYVTKILQSRAAIGEFQPHRRIGGVRVPEGPPLLGLYPAAVDEVVFMRAQAQRATLTRVVGRRGKAISNLFTGYARCGACKGVMRYISKGKPGEQYLVCDNALRLRQCEPRVYFNYPRLESAVIERLLHLVVTPDHFERPPEAHKAELDVIKQRKLVDDLDGRQRRLVDLLSRTENAEAERQLVDLATSLELARTELKGLVKQRDVMFGRGVANVRLRQLRQLLEDARSLDDAVRAPARALIQSALFPTVGPIICDPGSRVTSVFLGPMPFEFDREGGLVSGPDMNTLTEALARMEDEAALEAAE